MTLQAWLENRWIVELPTSDEELRSLRSIVERELKDSRVEEISLDAKLGMLYNAALKLSEMALRAHGFRVRQREGSRPPPTGGRGARKVTWFQHLTPAEITMLPKSKCAGFSRKLD
jgi:hypothetical protein